MSEIIQISDHETEVFVLLRDLKRRALVQGIPCTVANLIHMAVEVGVVVIAEADTFAILNLPVTTAGGSVLFALDDATNGTISLLFENDFHEQHRAILNRLAEPADIHPTHGSTDSDRAIGGDDAGGGGGSPTPTTATVRADHEQYDGETAPSEHSGAGRVHGEGRDDSIGASNGCERSSPQTNRIEQSASAECSQAIGDNNSVGDGGVDPWGAPPDGGEAESAAAANTIGGTNPLTCADGGNAGSSPAVGRTEVGNSQPDNAAGCAESGHREQGDRISGSDTHDTVVDCDPARGDDAIGGAGKTQSGVPIPAPDGQAGGVLPSAFGGQAIRSRGRYIHLGTGGGAVITKPTDFKHLLLEAELATFEDQIKTSESRLQVLGLEIARAEELHGKWLNAITVSRSISQEVSLQIVERKAQLAQLDTKLGQVRDILRGLPA